MAFTSWRSTRRESVFIPRSTSQQSNGANAVPWAFCRKAIRRARSASRTATNPLIVSLCPLKNLVPLCITTWHPSCNGKQRHGVIIVLSTLTSMPNSVAILARHLRSVIFMSGFDGLSTWMSLVRPAIKAERITSRSDASSVVEDVSMKVTSTPNRAVTWVNRRCMPPYKSLIASMWSPCVKVETTQDRAAIPDVNANAECAPSNFATSTSIAVRVGFPDRV
mmetsp:Transcript_36687/g.42876  ORF Transcript_36687/g.42876 Transcript_36687/m.42876 type:complete len:222 (-) Transcript_36687:571-1236(-)